MLASRKVCRCEALQQGFTPFYEYMYSNLIMSFVYFYNILSAFPCSAGFKTPYKILNLTMQHACQHLWCRSLVQRLALLHVWLLVLCILVKWNFLFMCWFCSSLWFQCQHTVKHGYSEHAYNELKFTAPKRNWF